MTPNLPPSNRLPVGQQAREDFPRFGVTRFAAYRGTVSAQYRIEIGGDVQPFTITQADFDSLERVEQVSDFHCVTTWSYRGARWGGFRFKDVYQTLIQPRLTDNRMMALVAFRAHDKYKSSLLLEDALFDDVLLADRLDGELLSAKHGAPLRIVAPAHYGYKNVKHLQKMEFWQDTSSYQPAKPRFAEHARARVAFEERGRYLPGWIFRYLYRPLIDYAVRRMRQDE